MKAKKRTSIENAISLLRQALREKYGEGTSATILIKEDSVSLDDDEGCVICDKVSDYAIADNLAGK